MVYVDIERKLIVVYDVLGFVEISGDQRLSRPKERKHRPVANPGELAEPVSLPTSGGRLKHRNYLFLETGDKPCVERCSSQTICFHLHNLIGFKNPKESSTQVL